MWNVHRYTVVLYVLFLVAWSAKRRVPRSHQYVMSSVPCYLGHFGPTNISVVVDVVT